MTDSRSQITRIGAYGIVQDNDHILLCRLSPAALSHQGMWTLPGGGLECGEHPEEGLVREVMEETGWRMDKPRRIGVYKRFVFMPDYDMWAEKICTIYWSRPTLCLGPPLEDSHTAVWVPMNDAPALLSNDGDATFVASLL